MQAWEQDHERECVRRPPPRACRRRVARRRAPYPVQKQTSRLEPIDLGLFSNTPPGEISPLKTPARAMPTLLSIIPSGSGARRPSRPVPGTDLVNCAEIVSASGYDF